jgi:hypothetical protein
MAARGLFRHPPRAIYRLPRITASGERIAGSFTADAVLKRAQTGVFVADAVIRRARTGSLTRTRSFVGRVPGRYSRRGPEAGDHRIVHRKRRDQTSDHGLFTATRSSDVRTGTLPLMRSSSSTGQ